MSELKLPKIEKNSFYHPYQPHSPHFYPDVKGYMQEYITSYIDYEYDSAGNCKMVEYSYNYPQE